MILVDASVWIDHFRRPIAHVADLTETKDAATHPLVIGELAMGSLPDRRATLKALGRLPSLAQATHSEVMAFVEWHRLFNCGIGYVDAHLLASARFTDGCLLWTHDKRLRREAERLEIALMLG